MAIDMCLSRRAFAILLIVALLALGLLFIRPSSWHAAVPLPVESAGVRALLLPSSSGGVDPDQPAAKHWLTQKNQLEKTNVQLQQPVAASVRMVVELTSLAAATSATLQHQQGSVQLKLPLVEPPPAGASGSTHDEHLYALLAANGVANVRTLEQLDQSSVAALTNRLHTDADTMRRIFGMMYAFRGNFHQKSYAFVLEPPACASDFRGTVMIVYSLPSERADRDRVRSTWAAELLSLAGKRRGGGIAADALGGGEPLQIRVLFIMGRAGGASAQATAAMVSDEARRHGDLLVADFEEGYHNLTIKSLLMMRWTLSGCRTARLLIKVDTDVQVVPRNFLSALKRHCLPAKRSFLGWVSSYDFVHRDPSSKWYVPPAVYRPDTYPPFAHGPCYVVTVDLLDDLLRVASRLDYLHLEDVFVSAVCVQRLPNTKLVPIPDFVSWDCNNRRAAVYHGVRCI